MNKEEATQELQNQARHHCGEIECYKDGCEKSVELSRVINIVSCIDEPQKVVIPKIVADWIEECKTNCFSISYALYRCPEMSDRHGFTSTFDQDTFADAWVNGYEIEPEKLYTVEIPNPNMNAHVILQKTKNKVVLIVVTNARWKDWEGSNLTESEIKQDFAWAWDAGFAREVEDELED